MRLGKRSTKGAVRNATKVFDGGYTFDSKLEHFFWKRCIELGIDVEVKPEKFEVLPKFKFHAESVRAITYTPDFYLPEHNVIIETKGYAMPDFALRLKMFKKHLVDTGRTETYKQLKNQKEIDAYLNTLTK